MLAFTTYVNSTLGIHARPCMLLSKLYTGFFPGEDIIFANLTIGTESHMSSLLGMMNVIADYEHKVEFIALLEKERFNLLYDLVHLLYYNIESGTNNPSYVSCSEILDSCRTVDALYNTLSYEKEGKEFIFSQSVSDKYHGSHQDGHNILLRLDKIDWKIARDYSDAISLIEQRKASGLGSARRTIERLINLIIELEELGSLNRSLKQKVDACCEASELSEFDKQFLHIFRIFGNIGVHDYSKDDLSLFPDREALEHLTDMFSRLVRCLLAFIEDRQRP